ncbi:MAG: 1-(5-phosphoribosyl)-5-[(5-phosphoribosylamino)methylideneamino]imidazole-4-carboxamide isomerase [Thermodesulfobacteriota bacterium]
MEIIPAIDLKDGKCVRLLKGEEGTETVFSTNPVETAQNWEACGAGWIHLVDLDGAFQGVPKNFAIIEDIVKETNSSIQIGGGIRDIGTIERYISAGVKRVIIGTKAFIDDEFMKEACDKYPRQIAVGVDTKNEKIAIKGWKEVLDISAEDVISKLEGFGVSMLINTNVDKDGTMEGINTEPIENFINLCTVPVIASGGIATTDDLEKLSHLNTSGLHGVILGKSIYSGSIDLKQAIERYGK